MAMKSQSVVATSFLLACGTAAALLAAEGAAPKSPKAQSPRYEYRAVSFPAEEKAATDKLNALSADGWEYVGPLAHSLVAFRRPQSPPRGVADRLQGTWARVSIQRGDRRFGASATDLLTFTGNRFEQRVDGTLKQAGTFSVVSADGDPIQIDLLCAEGPRKGTHYRCIARFEGDHLHLCTDDGDNARPKEFSGTAGFYRVAKRQKR
jgi:uncharacterized protein (TIGR03067 family)